MKKLVSIILILAMVLSFAACGKEEDSPKKGKERDTDKTVTGTPTAEPTGEPTGEPTPEPTGEATPTPTPTESPKPTEILNDDEVYVGTFYVIAEGNGNDYYSDLYTGPDMQVFRSEIDYLYITEAGFDALAATIRAQNNEAFQRNKEMCNQVADILALTTEKIEDQWFDLNSIMVWRSDSRLFSYDREDVSYLGGASSYKYRTGYTIDTKTGEPVDLATVITDIKGFTEDVIELIEPYADDLNVWDNWEVKVREGIANGELGWVATDDGLQVWFDNGYLAPYTTGEVCVRYDVKDHLDRFNKKYLGAYVDGVKMGRTRNTPSIPRSGAYLALLANLTDHFMMDRDDVIDILEDLGIAYEGVDYDETEAYEADPFLKFYAPDSEDKIIIDFWPDSDEIPNVRRLIRTIDVYVSGYEFFMFINRDNGRYLTYTIVDCSFDGSRDGADVYNLNDALDLLFTTMMTYYSDVVSKN